MLAALGGYYAGKNVARDRAVAVAVQAQYPPGVDEHWNACCNFIAHEIDRSP